MYYDCGYENLSDETFEIDENRLVRAYTLSNGDVFTVNELMLEYEDAILYEVTEVRYGVIKTYIRTGRKFTLEQINEALKSG